MGMPGSFLPPVLNQSNPEVTEQPKSEISGRTCLLFVRVPGAWAGFQRLPLSAENPIPFLGMASRVRLISASPKANGHPAIRATAGSRVQ